MKTLHLRGAFSVHLLLRALFVSAGWLLCCGAFFATPVAGAAQERTPVGNPPEQEIHALFLPVVVFSPAGVQEFVPPGNSFYPVSPQQTGTVTPNVFFLHLDATGNLLARTDEAGRVVWRADVRPFGQGTSTSPDHPLRFAGQPQEAGLGGLYHLGARLYDPVSGRFLGPDPLPLTRIVLAEPQRFNRYAYGLNNPYRYADPSGLSPQGWKEVEPRVTGKREGPSVPKPRVFKPRPVEIHRPHPDPAETVRTGQTTPSLGEVVPEGFDPDNPDNVPTDVNTIPNDRVVDKEQQRQLVEDLNRLACAYGMDACNPNALWGPGVLLLPDGGTLPVPTGPRVPVRVPVRIPVRIPIPVPVVP